MSSSHFAFIPRKVAKTIHSQGPSSQRADNLPSPTGNDAIVVNESRTASKGKAKAAEDQAGGLASSGRKPQYTDEDYAVLVSMALSDHAIWSNPDLRRKCDLRANGGLGGEEQFIPLSYLLQHAPILSDIGHSESTESTVAKALRTVASDVFEVRMVVSETTLSTWKLKRIESFGLYEIRRKDWVTHPPQTTANYSRDDWEKRSIYVENIPPQFRTVPLIAHFILSLCKQAPIATPHILKIQNISLLPSHLDKPSDKPRYKGFALAVLSDVDDIDRLLTEWPWDRNKVQGGCASDTEAYLDSLKFGFRTLSKRRWAQLQEEYLAYRSWLLGNLPTSGDPTSENSSVDRPKQAPSSSSPPCNGPSQSGGSVNADHLPSYPIGCLVFVRNVHPETNKTTLRTLFDAAFDAPVNDGLDYVDFMKGMDSCHIRLKTVNHSRILVDFFSSHPRIQSKGLDDAGIVLESSADKSQAIKMEIVQSKREEVYWQKVPDKVRQQALQRARNQPIYTAMADNKSDADAVKPSRKRRKH